jgi:hypothetical protein
MSNRKLSWMVAFAFGMTSVTWAQSASAVDSLVPPPYCDKHGLGANRFLRCHVELSLNNGMLTLSVDPLSMPASIPVKVVWSLTQRGYFFDADDGILIQNPSGQFQDPCATNTDTGTCLTVLRPKHFKWFVTNTAAFQTPYCIRFTHQPSGEVFSFDPTIDNAFTFDRAAPRTKKSISPSACGPIHIEPAKKK